MSLELDFGKSVEENASLYFEKSKKAKKKLLGLKAAIVQTKARMKTPVGRKAAKPIPAKKQKHEWFHEFKWFFSSSGFLVVAGKSAKSNEQLVKKHLEKEDFFLHADIPGGAATIIKADGRAVDETTFSEAAQFAAVFSRAWKQQLPAVDVYAVEPEQVSKKAPSGTSLGTGAFMIYGKRKWFRKTPLKLAIGVNAGSRVIAGPPEAIKKQSGCTVEVLQGKLSAGQAAKKVAVALKPCLEKGTKVSLDEVMSALPSENIAVK